MSNDSPRRAITLQRTSLAHYVVRNERGGTIELGDGSDSTFTPVEALLAALAGCSSIDVDQVTSRRAEPTRFEVTASGNKIDDDGSRLDDLVVSFRLEFPDGPDGDQARARIAAAITASHDRNCTVSRTVEAGPQVSMVVADR